MVIGSFLFFLSIFLAIGLWSARYSRSTPEDYLLAGRSVPAWLTALSAVATNNSGFMFIGLIGLTYKAGISSIWIMVGWIAGDYCAWRFVHRPFRVHSAALGSRSIPEFLASDRSGKRSRGLSLLAAALVIVFLGVYAAAQLKAGAKALHVLFGWDYYWGATIGVVIIAAYCLAGGLRASIWTDAAQSMVMILSMTLLLAAALWQSGGVAELLTNLKHQDPQLLNWRPLGLSFGFGAYLLSWLFAGFGVLGQPHIMVRPMSIESPDKIASARRIYFLWYIAFTVACVCVGLACRALLPAEGFDAELALPRLTSQLLPSVLTGLTLAGVFAATMSTADSQVLSCSAAITHDLFPRTADNYWASKAATLSVSLLIYLAAVSGSQSVFELVVDAWAALAAALAPLLLLRALRRPLGASVAITMALSGLAAATAWRFADPGWRSSLYAALPGMSAGFLVYLASRLFARNGVMGGDSTG
ncbi:MAG: sodium/proline symporter [Leptospirales bacterium]|nr:sodium/proline symporter [Leptospirales bacterium]